jgi:signal transduction histidine kinase
MPGLETLFSEHPGLSFPPLFQKLVDDLPEQIALVDEHWTILSVNASWERAVADIGFDGLTPGANYKTFCKIKAKEGHKAPALIAPILEDLESGQKTSFTLNYTGDGELAGRDYETRIALFRIGERQFATITRTDLTELHYLRRVREGLSGSLEETRQAERDRIGRELHDSTMQFLVGAALSLGQLRRSGVGLKEEGLVSEIEGLLVKAQDELRSISYLGQAPELERGDLAHAVTTLVEGFARRAGLKASTQIIQPLSLPGKSAQGALYRVLQEAISNVHRHSKATEMGVRLVARGPALHLIIADNGIGFPHQVNEGVGLQSMHSRLREIGGCLQIRNLPQGSAVVAIVPLVDIDNAGMD